MKPCRVIQLLRRLLPAEGRLARRWLQPHGAACPECRRAHEHDLALGAALRAHAVEYQAPAPPFLASRIKVAVRAAAVEPRQMRAGRWFAAVTAGVAVVVLAIALWPTRLGSDPSGAAAAEFTREQTEALVRQVDVWSPETAWTLAGGVDRSLQSELDAILSDARSAALLIVRACVPEEAPVRLLPE